jgi:hypothetical protein
MSLFPLASRSDWEAMVHNSGASPPLLEQIVWFGGVRSARERSLSENCSLGANGFGSPGRIVKKHNC